MKKRFLSIFLALCIVLTAFPTYALAAGASGAIQGTVVDIETQQPIEATVSLYARGDTNTVLASTTSTSSTGAYTLAPSGGVSAGEYTLIFTNNLYLSRSLDIEITSSDGLIIAAATGLYPVGRCDGTVTDADTGAALSGVTVNVYRTTSGDLNTSTTTGADGKYSIETQAGVYNLEFVKNGYTTTKLERISLGAISTTNNAKMAAGTSGDDQEEIAWKLVDGVLTISGEGIAMPDYDYDDYDGAPWDSWRDNIKTIIIEDGITSIGKQAFFECNSLTSITIPDSVTSIGDSAFEKCSSLISITIPDGVTSIGEYAFCRCSSLTTITIPNGITSIGDGMFSGCNSLISATIPESITNIGDSAFEKCSSLTTITIPDRVTSIGNSAFEGCSGLISITIPDSVTNISNRAFLGCSSLTNINIPNGVTRINNRVFSGCRGLTSITIPNGTTTIGELAFYACSSLTSIIIPSSIAYVVQNSFERCDGLTDIYYGSSKDLWQTYFYDVYFPADVTIHYNSTGPDDPPISDEIIFRSDDDFTVYIDNTSTIFANIPNVGNLQKSDITWSSNDEAVVAIESSNMLASGNTASATAVVRGVSAGTATITVTLSDGRSASCQVNVSAEPNTIQFSYISSLPVNTSQSLSAKIKLNTIVAGDEIVWTSSDSSILAFDTNGSASVSHPFSTIPTDSVVTDSVTLYGRGTGKVKITCRMPASGVEASVDVLVYADKTDGLKKLAANWKTAYEEYVKAILYALNQHKKDTVSGGDLSDTIIQKEAEKLKEADASSKNGKLVNFVGDYGNNPNISEHVYRAVAEFLAKTTAQEYAVGNVDVSSGNAIKISASIVNLLLQSIDVKTYEYQSGNTKILIGGFSGLGTHERVISYKIGSSKSVEVAALVSTKEQVEDAIKDYVNELMKLEKNAIKEAWKQVKKEIFDLGLDNLTKAKISEKLGPYTQAFEQTKVGKVVTTLETCVDYWKYVKKIINLSSADPMQLVTDLPTMETFTFTSDSISDKTVNAAMKGIDSAKNRLEDAIAQYLLTGNIDVIDVATQWGKDTLSGAKSEFMCPVNIAVYDSTGMQVGYVGEDDIWYNGDTVYIERYGDTKTIYSNGVPLRFEITATDDGTLNCTFEEYADGTALNRVNYYDIPLYEAKSIIALVPKETLTTDTVIVTVEGTENISADECIVAAEYKTATVDITGTVNNAKGGQVYGSGQYVRGDAVTMLAMAESGYVFLGWQNSDGALESISSVYEFTAREGLTLTALFAPNVGGENTSAYTITFDANGGIVSPANMTTEEDGTLSSLPTPTRTTYTFLGWYTTSTGGTRITLNTVFDQDTTVYAQWTYDNSNIGNDTPYYPGGSGTGNGSNNGTSYSINTPSSVTGGTVTVSPKSAEKGDTVTILVTPDNGYELAYITVTDKNGDNVHLTDRGDGKYILIMPDSNVTLDCAFKLIETDSPNQPTISFIDVIPSAYYYDAVAWAAAQGITTGTTANTFSPDAPCTRGQIVTFLWRAAGSPSVSGSNPFTDVQSGDYWYDAVLWAVSKGITTGTSATTFSPNDTCTRGQAVTFLYRNAGSPAETTSAAFTDVVPGAYYSNAVAWALAKNITNGTTATTFSPDDKCTRGQIVTFLYRSLGE